MATKVKTGVLGTLTELNFADNGKARFGAGNDLQIFHDGSNSYIQSTTGNFNLTTDGGNEFALTAVNNGAVSLFHNGSAKLATTSTGATVTGALTTNGARNIIQRANDDSSIAFSNNASGTPSSHTWAIGLDYSASNGLAIAYANNGIPSLTGSNLVQIDTSGKVGIGTPSPTEKLTVNGALAVTGSLIDDRTATGTMDYVSGITRFVAYGGSGSENGQIAFNTAVGGGSSTVKARVSAGFTNTSTTALPAFRTEGSYGGGIGMLDGASQAGWYQQDNGDTFHHYVGKESSDTPASKIVLTTRSNGHVGIMHGGSAAINHPLHVTREEAGYQVKFDNDNGSAQGLAIRIKANDSGNFNAINTVSASSGSDKTVFNVRDDGIVTTPEQPKFLARRNVSGGSYNPHTYSHSIPYNAEVYDEGNNFNTSTGLFTAPVDGMYMFQGAIYSVEASSGGWVQAWLTINGARGNYTDVAGNGMDNARIISTIHMVKLDSGDTVGYHPYGSNQSYQVYDNVHHTWFRGTLLG